MGKVIEIKDEFVDVDLIMQKIQASIEEKKKSQIYVEEPWMLQDISQPQLRLNIQSPNDTLTMLRIAGRLDLEGEPISSHRWISGGFIKYMKRMTRFWIRKYTDAIFFKQSHFNMELVNALSQMNEQVQLLKKENQELKEKLDQDQTQ